MPLTCSPLDLNWSIKLPPVTHEEIQIVKVTMITETELFSFLPDSGLVILKPETKVAFLQG